MLDPRAIATLGIGYGADLLARIGLWGVTQPSTTSGQSGVSRLARSLWKPPVLKLSREFIEDLQARALEEDAKRKTPPAPIPTPTPAQTKPPTPVKPSHVASPARVVYRPHTVAKDPEWEQILARINKTYLQLSKGAVEYKRIRDEAQREIDDEEDLMILLMYH